MVIFVVEGEEGIGICCRGEGWDSDGHGMERKWEYLHLSA
jgi:hypothetical protein